MGKVKLGCDLDGVIFHSMHLYLKYIREKTGRSLTPRDIECYTNGKVLEEAGEIIKEAIKATLTKDILPLVEGLGCLKIAPAFFEHNPLPCITSRPPSFREATEKQLATAFVDSEITTEVVFTRRSDGEKSQGKSQLVRDLGLEYFIEDAPVYIVDIAENTDCTVLVFDQPWNQDVKPHSRIIRMGSWKHENQWPHVYTLLREKFRG